MPQIQDLGGTLLAMTPQLPEWSRGTIESRRLGFDFLTDAGNEVAAEFGLRHALPDELREIYEGFGVDLAATNGDDSWTLPMPARYVIDTAGIIRYARVHPDYTRRPEVDETLAALAEV